RGRRVIRIVDLQVGISLAVSIDNVVYKALVGPKTPGGTGAKTHSGIFATPNELRGAFVIARPMKLTAGIDQSLDLEIRTVEYRLDERVVIVEFGIRCDYNPGLLPPASVLLRRNGRGT